MITVVYFAKRSLKAGVNVGDPITLTFNATSSELGKQVNKTSTDSLGLITQTSYFGSKRTFSISPYRTEGVTFEDFTMFFDSVEGGELFTLTDFDTGDDIVVIQTGTTTYSRITNFNQGDFKYSFTVKEQ